MSRLSLRRAYTMVGQDIKLRLQSLQEQKRQIEADIKLADADYQACSMRLALHDAVKSGNLASVADVAKRAIEALEPEEGR